MATVEKVPNQSTGFQKTKFLDALLKSGGTSKEQLLRVAVYQNIQANAAAVDELLKESRKLYDAGNKKRAQKLLDIAGQIINNNKELRNTVGDVLNDE